MENLTDKYEGWKTPQRQSAAAIFIILLQTIAGFFKATWPIVAVALFRTQKDKPDQEANSMRLIIWSSAATGLALFIIIVTLLKYWFYKFHIEQGALIIQSGWLKKKTLSVPLKNIHAVHIEQSPWQRVLQVAKITIDSAGSEETEAKIDALSMKNASHLKLILLSEVGTSSEVLKEERIHKSMQTRLSIADLIKFSLTANHLEAFFILIGLSLNLIDNLKDAFKIDSWGIMETYALKLAGQTTVVITILVIIVAIISIIVSIIRTLFKFYNFNIEKVQQGWKIAFGLLTHKQKIIPYNKIQILSWRSNWIRRKIDFWVLNVQSIDYFKPTQKDRIQIPITSLQGVLSLAPIYQESPVFNVEEGLRITPDYWKTKTLQVGVPLTSLLGLILYFWLGMASIVIVLLLIYLGWYYNTWYKVFRWQVNEEGLQLYSGVWGRKYTLLAWKKVQQVQLSQSPYQRSHHLASVVFYTAGGLVEIPYIPYKISKDVANLAMYYVESRNAEWM